MGNIWANSQGSISSSFFRLKTGPDFSLSLFQDICKGGWWWFGRKIKCSVELSFQKPPRVYGQGVLCQKMGRYNGKTAEPNLGARFGPMSKSQKSYFEKFTKIRI